MEKWKEKEKKKKRKNEWLLEGERLRKEKKKKGGFMTGECTYLGSNIARPLRQLHVPLG